MLVAMGLRRAGSMGLRRAGWMGLRRAGAPPNQWQWPLLHGELRITGEPTRQSVLGPVSWSPPVHAAFKDTMTSRPGGGHRPGALTRLLLRWGTPLQSHCHRGFWAHTPPPHPLDRCTLLPRLTQVMTRFLGGIVNSGQTGTRHRGSLLLAHGSCGMRGRTPRPRKCCARWSSIYPLQTRSAWHKVAAMSCTGVFGGGYRGHTRRVSRFCCCL